MPETGEIMPESTVPETTVEDTKEKNEISPEQAKIDALSAERDELREMLLRRTAEFDNYRKRTEKERSEYLQFAGMDLVRELLPVLDDFERALKTECKSPDFSANCKAGIDSIRLTARLEAAPFQDKTES